MALIGWARSVLAVVVDGAKILWGYWPTLLVIFLVGQALRNALLWLAVVVSSYTSVGAALLVPLAPLATLSALILMLRAVAPALSLSVEPPPVETGPSRIRARLDLLASTLVPFLAVYAAQGYLIEDRWVFVQEAVADEFTNGSDFWLGGSFDTGRTTVADGWAYWALVAVAFGLRWLVDRLDLPRKARGWGLVAAYLEATWVLLFATALARRISGIWDWVEQRAFVATIYGWWEQATSWLGPLTDPVRSFMSYIWGAIGGADAVVMVPLAWLTLGAVVYGRSLEAAEPETPARLQPWRDRVQRMPQPVRRLGRGILGGTIERFSGLWSGLKTLARAGLAPMLLFCLIFALARYVEIGAVILAKSLAGPQDADAVMPFTPWLLVFTRAAYTMVLVSLLAAGIGRLINRQGSAAPEPVASPN